jgi:hypothetical protein
VLIVMFGVAFRLMRDLGFTPEPGGGVVTEVRRIAGNSDRVRLARPAP